MGFREQSFLEVYRVAYVQLALSLISLPVLPSWQGCVIIWDGRLIHSTCKPLRGRADPKPRFIVYGGWVPRSLLTGTRHSIQNRPQEYIMYMHCSQSAVLVS